MFSHSESESSELLFQSHQHLCFPSNMILCHRVPSDSYFFKSASLLSLEYSPKLHIPVLISFGACTLLILPTSIDWTFSNNYWDLCSFLKSSISLYMLLDHWTLRITLEVKTFLHTLLSIMDWGFSFHSSKSPLLIKMLVSISNSPKAPPHWVSLHEEWKV